MESTDSSAGGGGGNNQQPNLPPGFRFHPTDEELVVHYLKKKASSIPLPVSIIAEVDLYKFDPWELPAKATFGEQEWYFFSPRDRKYPNGVRPNRAATSGYWKATGTDKPVLTSGGTQKVGVKKALVFYGGKPPKGIKTNWIMHEYRLADNKVTNRPPGCDLGNKKNSLRLDDWVLCRIYKKNNNHGRSLMDQEKEDSMEDMLMMGPIPPSLLVSSTAQQNPRLQLGKGGGSYGTALLDHHHHQQQQQQQLHHHHQSLFEGIEPNSLAHANNHPNNNNTNSFFSHLAAAAASRQQLEVLPTMLPPLKRSSTSSSASTLLAGPSLFWPSSDVVVDHDPSSSKRFHDDEDDNSGAGGGGGCDGSNGGGGGSSSIASLLSQLPQTPSPTLHQQHHSSTASMLGSLGDGILRTNTPPYHHQQLPGMNWYS